MVEDDGRPGKGIGQIGNLGQLRMILKTAVVVALAR